MGDVSPARGEGWAGEAGRAVPGLRLLGAATACRNTAQLRLSLRVGGRFAEKRVVKLGCSLKNENKNQTESGNPVNGAPVQKPRGERAHRITE